MRTVVRNIFLEFVTRYTQCVGWMYLDPQGMVRTGIGSLLEPIDRALVLPWVSKDDGRKGELNEISADWVRVKKNRLLAHQQPHRARFVTQLELGKAGLEQVTFAQLDAYELELAAIFPHEAWEEYPANVQLVVMSMVWELRGVGELAGTWTPSLAGFAKAIREEAWATAAEHCFLDDRTDPSRKPRNWAHRKLLTVAATAEPEQLEKVTGWP